MDFRNSHKIQARARGTIHQVGFVRKVASPGLDTPLRASASPSEYERTQNGWHSPKRTIWCPETDLFCYWREKQGWAKSAEGTPGRGRRLESNRVDHLGKGGLATPGTSRLGNPDTIWEGNWPGLQPRKFEHLAEGFPASPALDGFPLAKPGFGRSSCGKTGPRD